ncbi:nuclear transport factor 2 family protein [Exiguobacterium sp. SH0S1]|uniref:nuclear transport factor 2 family protein n=1 Tax=Exiguobacterium sp. SH0S1 TaxID=2510949 RepID=UPI00103EB9F6|nr:nuclear transport factor 2 family protein [Exiguobacterium sp. SH0S1]TCI77817.1 nuclear transport factor 2 family protein [Exiguobacterium sp. SH0S1]
MNTQTVQELAVDRLNAQRTGDIVTMGQMMSEVFRYVDSSGRQFDKETYLDLFVDPDAIQWISQEMMTYQETIAGDVAIVETLLEEKFILGTNAYEGRFWALHIYRKEDGVWKWQGGQTTLVNEG